MWKELVTTAKEMKYWLKLYFIFMLGLIAMKIIDEQYSSGFWITMTLAGFFLNELNNRVIKEQQELIESYSKLIAKIHDLLKAKINTTKEATRPNEYHSTRPSSSSIKEH